jgi:hypothetical protein
LPSIQGEQRTKGNQGRPADPGDVDHYVDKVPEEYLICRERGTHEFPRINRKDPVKTFTGFDKNTNTLTRELRCLGCGAARRTEHWQWRRNRATFVGNELDYPAAWRINGVPYAMPLGVGKAGRVQVRESLASQCLSGLTLAQIKKQWA